MQGISPNATQTDAFVTASQQTPLQIDWQQLDTVAKQAQERAYCRYSNFHVGAALLSEDGTIIPGCNVESASYPATVCAETSAMAAAVAAGHTNIIAASVIGESPQGPTSPCGVCRQVLYEFNPHMRIHLLEQHGEGIFMILKDDLLPYGFGGADLT